MSLKSNAKKTITFYSYKGGVGRSMALANIAWLLSVKFGKKIVMIDWDLEAPGLHRFFQLKDEDAPQVGLIDLLVEFKNILTEKVEGDLANYIDIEDYLVDVTPTDAEEGNLRLLPAGTLDKQFIEKVRNFNWKEFYDVWQGFGVIEYIKGELEAIADYVLIDSRTGVTDIASICTRQLPDLVVLCFTYNDQNIIGTQGIAESITTEVEGYKVPDIILLPTKIEILEDYDSRLKWEGIAYEHLGSFLPAFLDSVDYFVHNRIPYIPRLSFGEIIAVKDYPKYEISEDYLNVTNTILRQLNRKLPLPPTWVQEKIRGTQRNTLKELTLIQPSSQPELTFLPIELTEIKQLESLEIQNCSIDKVPRDFRFLAKIKRLSLIGTSIADINFLGEFIELEDLILNSIAEIEDFSILQKLKKLESLTIRSSKVSDISFLQGLENLKTLDLGSNKISNIQALSNLISLKRLNLADNEIADISPLLNLIKDIGLKVTLENRFDEGKIILQNNPITVPPLETISRGSEATVKFLEDLAIQGKAKLFEAKLIIVGDGGAGKTSLVRKIEALDSEMPREGEDRTKGIDIQAMPVRNINDPQTPFLMNVWDFGGQGYYHSTHQFFLTKRSLYLLLNNTRINRTDFNDWLQTISSFSDDSPVILVENEVGGSKSELDLRGLQQYFDNILFVRNADISNTGDGRLQKLIQDIQIEIQRLPHIGSELPIQWVKVRKELGEMAKTEAFISNSRFFEICEKHQIQDKNAVQRLGNLFHDLGIFLYYQEDRILNRIVILQNSWATNGVYSILDNNLVRSQNGYFTIQQAENIWKNTNYVDLHHELVSLMEKFRLCYRIPYSSPSAYISPNLLPEEKPDYEWDNTQNLVINYDYEFMPKGLLGMLIVGLHRLVKDIGNLAWQKGCIFHYQKTDAQVVETYGKRKLEVRIRGANCVQLSSIIISEIDKLNKSFSRIKVKKLIPCPCGECSKSTTPEFYSYQDLMRRKEKGKSTIECPRSYEDINVLAILENSFDHRQSEIPMIRDLVASNNIREAIDLIEADFPTEGAILLSRFHRYSTYLQEGTLTPEEHSQKIEEIIRNILEFTERMG